MNIMNIHYAFMSRRSFLGSSILKYQKLFKNLGKPVSFLLNELCILSNCPLSPVALSFCKALNRDKRIFNFMGNGACKLARERAIALTRFSEESDLLIPSS